MFQNRKRCVKGHLIGFSSFLKVILNNCTSVSGASGLEALADLHVGQDTHLSIFIYYIFPACHQAICCGDPDKKAAAWRHIVIPYQALVLIQYSRSLFCWGGADLIRGHGSQIHRIDWLNPCQWVRGLLLSESILWTRWGICRRCCCLVGIKCVYIFFPRFAKMLLILIWSAKRLWKREMINRLKEKYWISPITKTVWCLYTSGELRDMMKACADTTRLYGERSTFWLFLFSY